MTGVVRVETDRRAWWACRRSGILVAVAIGYAISVVWYELLTPWWAGDHIGLSLGALVFGYGWGALLWLGGAYLLYGLAPYSEALVRPLDVSKCRRRVYAALVAVALVSPSISVGMWIIPAWLTHR